MTRLGRITREARFGRAMVGLTAASLLACSHAEDTANSRQALVGGTTCSVGQACALAMQYPSGVNPDQLAVVGLDGVAVGSGSRVLGRNGQSGALVANTGQIQLQASAQAGSIWTKGSAFVGSGAIVNGAFVANAQSVVQPGAVVPPRTVATGSLASVTWNVTFPASSQGNVNIEPDRSVSKAPGRYGDLRIASRSTLKLTTGTYYFDSLQTEPDSKVEVDNTGGTAVIYVRGSLVHRGNLISKGAPSDILVGSFSNGTIELGDQFDATLVAPSALIRVAQARNNAVHDGILVGKQVELQGGVRLSAAGISNTGPGVDGMAPTFVPDPNAPSPGPVPTPAGKTYDEYVAAKNAYIQQLLDQGYLGETKQFEVHPDAAKENQLSDFSVPANSTPAVSAPHVIPPRNPALHQPGQPAQDAVDEFRAEMADAEQAANDRYQALAQPDSTNQPGVQYGTDLMPPAQIPETCLFSQAPPPPPTIDPNTGTSIGSLSDFVIGPLVPDVVLGNRPDYLKFGAPGEGYETIDDKLPNFDGYWFFAGRLHGGWNGVGMEGMAEATVQAGGVLLKRHVELVRVAAFADGAILKQVDGDVKPYFASSLETKLLGKKIEAASWAASTNDPALAKLKRTLLNESRTLFEGTTPPTLQVGPFGLSLDGGAEVKVTLALNLDPNGPELTLSPTFRVYLTIFAGINLGIQIGVEGEADVVKVDMPFTAKLKWMDHLTPDTCYSSADFSVTFKTVWSTLNGKLYVTVRVKNPFPIGPDRIDIVREKITEWDGPTFDSGEVSLIPSVKIPLIHQDPSQCLLGAQDCAVKATPNRTAGIGQAFTVPIPYGQTDCPSQYVYEVPASTNTTNMWVRNQWQITDMDTEAECNDAKVRVDVWRLLSDGVTWTGWDSYDVKGVWQQGVGCQTSFSGGKLPGGETNGTLGFPWSWVDTSGGVQKVRVAVGGGTACEPRPLSVGILDTPPI